MKLFSKTLYHGTPHDFEQFDTEHIGGGEGHQVHGWGLYFAEDKEIAISRYAKRLSKRKSKVVLKVDDKEYTFDDVMFWYDECREKHPDIPALFTTYADMYGIDKPMDVVLEHLQGTLMNNQEKDPEERLYVAELCKYKDDVSRQEFMDELQKAIDFINQHDISVSIVSGKGSVFTVEVPDDLVFIDEKDWIPVWVVHKFGMTESEFETKMQDELLVIINSIPELREHNYKESVVSNLTHDFINIHEYFEEDNWNGLDEFVKEIMERYDGWNNIDKRSVNKICFYLKGIDFSKVFEVRQKTFDDFYYRLSQDLGGIEEASMALEYNGVNGITYYGREDGRCYVIFNPNNINIIQKESLD